MTNDMLSTRSKKRYISIFSDGTFRENVDKHTEGAVERIHEKQDGSKVTKWELIYNDLRAHITGIEFLESEYGEKINITFSNGTMELVLSGLVSSPFMEDIMKKLPNVNLERTLWVAPYAMELENGKTRKGVSIKQGTEKITSFFYDGKTNVNGYPDHDAVALKKLKKPSEVKEFWKIYFMQARRFLIAYTQENVCPKLQKQTSEGNSFDDFGADTEMVEPTE